MEDVCNKCGLPKSLCVCGEISKEMQKIKVKVVRRRFGKKITLLQGLSKDEAKRLGGLLKKKLACGGTVKNNEIELQGEQAKKAKAVLLKEGYRNEQIDL
ncbi:MAG: stress response translation initiation inhibitor YciH [archaeon]